MHPRCGKACSAPGHVKFLEFLQAVQNADLCQAVDANVGESNAVQPDKHDGKETSDSFMANVAYTSSSSLQAAPEQPIVQQQESTTSPMEVRDIAMEDKVLQLQKQLERAEQQSQGHTRYIGQQNCLFLQKQKIWTSTPGIEPGIFRSVGGRLIHWAMRNEAQEDLKCGMRNWLFLPYIIQLLRNFCQHTPR